MRTTVDLPPLLHRRALALARQRGQSLSATVAELTARGLREVDEPFEPIELRLDEVTGLPVLSIGRRITSQDVAAALVDD